MLSAETSALVAGGMRAPATAQNKPVAVRVLRPVMVAGQRIEPGAELVVEHWFAADLVTAGKAERVTAPAAVAPTPIPPPTASKAAKEKPRAQQ
jgi:hypothetical protein